MFLLRAQMLADARRRILFRAQHPVVVVLSACDTAARESAGELAVGETLWQSEIVARHTLHVTRYTLHVTSDLRVQRKRGA